MTPPSLLCRCLGYPPVTFTLLALYALTMAAWYADEIPFVIGFAIVLAVRKTMRAYDDVREFKEGEPLPITADEDLLKMPPPCRLYAGVAVRVSMAMVSLHISAFYLPRVPDGETAAQVLRGVWWLAFLYLTWALGRVVWLLHRYWKNRKSAPAPVPYVPDDEPVSWVLPVPESAPTREMAERELPEYCAALIQRGT
jgi:hypothetical protein